MHMKQLSYICSRGREWYDLRGRPFSGRITAKRHLMSRVQAAVPLTASVSTALSADCTSITGAAVGLLDHHYLQMFS